MSFLGVINASYVLLVKRIKRARDQRHFTVVNWRLGKHVKNVIPVLLGIFLVGLFNQHALMSTPALLAALIGDPRPSADITALRRA